MTRDLHELPDPYATTPTERTAVRIDGTSVTILASRDDLFHIRNVHGNRDSLTKTVALLINLLVNELKRLHIGPGFDPVRFSTALTGCRVVIDPGPGGTSTPPVPESPVRHDAGGTGSMARAGEGHHDQPQSLSRGNQGETGGKGDEDKVVKTSKRTKRGGV